MGRTVGGGVVKLNNQYVTRPPLLSQSQSRGERIATLSTADARAPVRVRGGRRCSWRRRVCARRECVCVNALRQEKHIWFGATAGQVTRALGNASTPKTPLNRRRVMNNCRPSVSSSVCTCPYPLPQRQPSRPFRYRHRRSTTRHERAPPIARRFRGETVSPADVFDRFRTRRHPHLHLRLSYLGFCARVLYFYIIIYDCVYTFD